MHAIPWKDDTESNWKWFSGCISGSMVGGWMPQREGSWTIIINALSYSVTGDHHCFWIKRKTYWVLTQANQIEKNSD